MGEEKDIIPLQNMKLLRDRHGHSAERHDGTVRTMVWPSLTHESTMVITFL